MVTSTLRSLWSEPRAPDPPRRVWRDWVFLAVLVVAVVLEGLLREDLVWRPVATAVSLAVVPASLWRRTHPLAVVAAVFTTYATLSVATALTLDSPIGGNESALLYSSAWVLLLLYSLLRWGSGREAVVGLSVVLVWHVATEVVAFTDVVTTVFGSAFLLLPAALGASIRYRTSSRLRAADEVKLRERAQLARELHDTVAHHVSAIAIQAQAGRVIAESDPQRAAEVLEVIEAEASRTLAEMRTMVGILRRGEEPDLAPQQGLADIERFARSSGELPHIVVELSGNLDDLSPSVGSAVYRLAQEAVTNALRHARHATRVDVLVAGGDDWVRLTVHDDGDASGFGPGRSPGYGLLGMSERATLLGGTFEAGPLRDRGWTVDAMLPRAGSTT